MNCPAAVFVDIPNMYHCLKHKGQKVDYVKYAEWLQQHFDIRFLKAYCDQKADPFIRLLNGVGFETYIDQTQYVHELVIDALTVAQNVDTIILGSTNNAYMRKLVESLKRMGKKIVIFAGNVPKEYATYGVVYHAEDILLQETKA